MSDEERALLRAVCENPADDLPRLVLSDWYDEHGQGERAEFIRCQVEYAKLPPKCERSGVQLAALRYVHHYAYRCRCRTCSLRRKASKLYARNAIVWTHGTALMYGFDWRRGFPTSLSVELSFFMERAGRFFESVPYERVRLGDVTPNPVGTRAFWFFTDQSATSHTQVERELGLLYIPVTRRHGREHWLPRVLLPYFGGVYHPYGINAAGEPEGSIEYRSVDEATADLSQALVRYGREKAGLTALEPVGV